MFSIECVPQRLRPRGAEEQLEDGFRVWGLGFRVLGLGFRVLGFVKTSDLINLQTSIRV